MKSNEGPQSSKPCVFFLQGRCTYGSNCVYSHAPCLSPPVCEHWANGYCRYGDNCFFKHTTKTDRRSPYRSLFPPAGSLQGEGPGLENQPGDVANTRGLEGKGQVCVFWMKGRCRFGVACRNLHDKGAMSQEILVLDSTAENDQLCVSSASPALPVISAANQPLPLEEPVQEASSPEALPEEPGTPPCASLQQLIHCSVCHEDFDCPSALYNHMQDFHPQSSQFKLLSKQHRCPCCSATLSTFHCLSSHIRISHRESLPFFQQQVEFDKLLTDMIHTKLWLSSPDAEFDRYSEPGSSGRKAPDALETFHLPTVPESLESKFD